MFTATTRLCVASRVNDELTLLGNALIDHFTTANDEVFAQRLEYGHPVATTYP